MHNRLLFSNITDVPIEMIQRLTADAMEIELEMMFLPNKYPGAKKREYVTMRQISMALSKSYTKLSLATIGRLHGNRDHATVLHAVDTVNALLDTRDHDMVEAYKNSLQLIKDWNATRKDEFYRSTLKELRRNRKNLEYRLADTIRRLNHIISNYKPEKNSLIKMFIRNHVPLEIRQQKLNIYVFNNKRD